MDTTRLKRFAAEARNILMQGVAHRLTALGFEADGTPTEEPQLFTGGATFMGEVVSEDFYNKWQSLKRAISYHNLKDVVEEAAYTWFNRLVAIRIMVKNGFIAPILQYESEGVHVPLLVTEARQGRLPIMNAYDERLLSQLLDDDSKTTEQFQILIVAFCHQNPIINKCFGHISDYTELLLPTNILAEGGFIDLLNNTPFIDDADFKSAELIGWLYQFYISEKKDDVYASFKAGKKAEAEDIPAATQIFTPNWIVKYMVQNTLGRIYLDNNPYDTVMKDKMQYLVEPSEPTPEEAKFKYESLEDLRLGDLACGSGHILNEFFDLMYLFYIEDGYSRRNAIENIFLKNLTGIDLDTRAKQLAQFALMVKACQKDPSFLDARVMPNVLDMPAPLDMNMVKATLPEFFIGGNMKMLQETEEAFNLLQQAENLGSIMKFNISDSTCAAIEIRLQEWEAQQTENVSNGIKSLFHPFRLILALTKKYSALVTNPPYMGLGNMNKELSLYIADNYTLGRNDLFSTFMILSQDLLLDNGRYGMINMQSWAYLGSYVDLRSHLLTEAQIDSFLFLGANTFDELSGEVVQNVSFVVTNHKPISLGVYYDLTEGKSCKNKESLFLCKRDIGKYSLKQNKFFNVSGCPIMLGLSDTFYEAFTNTPISNYCISNGQNITGNNAKYLRLFWEIAKGNVNKNYWTLCSRGGGYRKYYGNTVYTILWTEEARCFYKKDTIARIISEDLRFRWGITWSYVCSGHPSFRVLQPIELFEKAGTSVFLNNKEDLKPLLGLLNSKFSFFLLGKIAPGTKLQVRDLFLLPVSQKIFTSTITEKVDRAIGISKLDWDAHETSWDFEINPLLKYRRGAVTEKRETAISVNEPDLLKTLYGTYKAEWEQNFMQLHSNEEELNRQFIEIYGLQDELTPDVPLDEITILQQGEISIEDNHIVWHPDVIMKQLISYAVGCMMGRYSLDKDGLILANQGDGLKQFHELVPGSKFEPDDDGIIPLMSAQSDFADNATVRFKHWLAVAFGEETLVENLNFIEASLGKSIDDYFVKDFWKDHKKMYQNRPIYWLFSSKKGAFQCLTYMHRMDAYTAERVRTKYLLPHIEWLLQKQNELNNNLANLTSQERRELDNITKQIQECREYHDRLHVIADHQIGFDLDDGVVVNYAKFGDVLAAIK